MRPTSQPRRGAERHVLISASRRKKVPGLEVGETDESAVVFRGASVQASELFNSKGGDSGSFPPTPHVLLSNF